MKLIKTFLLTACVLTIWLTAPQSHAQGTTAFTYQGQLRDGGTNANGAYTMIFKLYDAASSGNPIGTNTSSPTLANGLFSVNLDFGNVFNGSARWLDITAQSGTNAPETLTPRVQVLPTPYALYAAVAATVTNGAIKNAQLAGNAVNGTNIADGQVIKSLNGLSDTVTLSAHSNIYLSTNGNEIAIAADLNNIYVDEFSVTTLYGIGLWAGDSGLGLQNGYITLDTVASGGPPHDFDISPDGTVSMGHSLYVSSNGAFGGNMQVNGNMLISSGLTAYGACSLGDLYAHDIVSQNNLTAQGGVIGGYASFTGDVTARGYNTSSDRAAKENFLPITSRDILEKVVGLPISRWNFKADATTQHIGPMAQDFYAAFNVGLDDKHIATVDEGGVALAAIQGLHEIVREKDADIAALKQRLTDLEKAVSELAKQKGNTP